MASYNLHEARSDLSRLLKRTEQGEQVIIMRNGKAVAELIPYRERGKNIRLGFAAGQVRETAGWERPMSGEETAAFLQGKR